MALTQVSGNGIKDGSISNVDINSSAVIDGSKISPNFGSQNTTTTGTSTAASFIPSSSTVPTNGIYLPAANSVAISTNGTERMRLDSSGRLGLGTSSPLTPLAVSGGITGGNTAVTNSEIAFPSAQANAYLRLLGNYQAGAGRGGTIQLGGKSWSDIGTIGAFLISAESADNTTSSLTFSTQTAFNNSVVERVRITSSGNIGIGTTSPEEKLDVRGKVYLNNGSATYIDAGASDGLVMTNPTAVRWEVGTGEKARIDSSGRLLVGTSSTSGNATLHVNKGSSGGTDAGGLLLSNLAAFSSIGAGDDIGYINFGASTTGSVASYDAARILCEADATWGSNDYPTRLVFSTTADGASSPTERMRISQDGRSAVYTSSASGFSINSSRSAGITENLMEATYSATGVYTGTLCMLIRTNGNLLNTNNSYGSLSDIKLKENIVNAKSQWDDLKSLQVRNYNFKEGQTHTQIGLIAQEVELVSPGLVSESPDLDEDGNDLGTTTKSVNYSVLYMKAVKALQEAMERIETLEASNAALETRIAALEVTP